MEKKNSKMHRISLPDEYLDKLDKPYINQNIIKDDRTIISKYI